MSDGKFLVHGDSDPIRPRAPRWRKRWCGRSIRRRNGVASLDYVLILAVVLPMLVFVMWAGPRIIRLAYEMIAMLVSWPFM